MKIINSFLILSLTSSFLFSQNVEKVIAKVNGEAILSSDFDKNKEILIEQYSLVSPEILKEKDSMNKIDSMVMDKIINETLLKQKAENSKIKIYDRQIDEGINEIEKRFNTDNKQKATELLQEELKKQGLTMSEFREKVKKDLMARKLIEEQVRSNVKTPEEKEIKDYYDNVVYIINNNGKKKDSLNEEKYQEYKNIAEKFKELIAERVKLRHILIKPESDDLLSKNKALEKAKSIKKELDNGADFEELAKKYSDDKQSAVRGGDLGYVIPGMLPKELDNVSFKMCPGDISKPVESTFGYHILRVDEKRIPIKLKYDDAKADIANIIMQNNFANEIENYTNKLRKEAKIEIFNESK